MFACSTTPPDHSGTSHGLADWHFIVNRTASSIGYPVAQFAKFPRRSRQLPNPSSHVSVDRRQHTSFRRLHFCWFWRNDTQLVTVAGWLVL